MIILDHEQLQGVGEARCSYYCWAIETEHTMQGDSK